MRITITNNEIQFIYFFFTIIIPNKDIKYTFEDLRFVIGLPISLKIESKQMKIISRFGFLGKIAYHLSIFLFIDNTYSYNEVDSLTTISHKQNIEKFLLSLQRNNYNVSKQFEELKHLVNKPIPKFINVKYLNERIKVKKREEIIIN